MFKFTLCAVYEFLKQQSGKCFQYVDFLQIISELRTRRVLEVDS